MLPLPFLRNFTFNGDHAGYPKQLKPLLNFEALKSIRLFHPLYRGHSKIVRSAPTAPIQYHTPFYDAFQMSKNDAIQS